MIWAGFSFLHMKNAVLSLLLIGPLFLDILVSVTVHWDGLSPQCSHSCLFTGHSLLASCILLHAHNQLSGLAYSLFAICFLLASHYMSWLLFNLHICFCSQLIFWVGCVVNLRICFCSQPITSVWLIFCISVSCSQPNICVCVLFNLPIYYLFTSHYLSWSLINLHTCYQRTAQYLSWLSNFLHICYLLIAHYLSWRSDYSAYLFLHTAHYLS